MINWSFPTMPDNRIPAETTTNALSGWEYRPSGETALAVKGTEQ